MKAYIKKNLVESGNGRKITDDMRKLEGTIIDVVWSYNCWRSEGIPFRHWNDDWLMIISDEYDLATAIGEILWLCDIYINILNTIAIRDKEIASYKTRIDGLMDSIAQRDAMLLNIKDRIDYLYTK